MKRKKANIKDLEPLVHLPKLLEVRNRKIEDKLIDIRDSINELPIHHNDKISFLSECVYNIIMDDAAEFVNDIIKDHEKTFHKGQKP